MDTPEGRMIIARGLAVTSDQNRTSFASYNERSTFQQLPWKFCNRVYLLSAWRHEREWMMTVMGTLALGTLAENDVHA